MTTFSLASSWLLKPTPSSMIGARPPAARIRRRPAGKCRPRAEERALARAVAPGDPEELPATDPEANVAQDVELGRRRHEPGDQPLAQRVNPPVGSRKLLKRLSTARAVAPGFIDLGAYGRIRARFAYLSDARRQANMSSSTMSSS